MFRQRRRGNWCSAGPWCTCAGTGAIGCLNPLSGNCSAIRSGSGFVRGAPVVRDVGTLVMAGERVIRRENCIAPARLECSRCARVIMLGAPYLRVRIDEPDEDGVLVEIKRLTLCLHCREGCEED